MGHRTATILVGLLVGCGSPGAASSPRSGAGGPGQSGEYVERQTIVERTPNGGTRTTTITKTTTPNTPARSPEPRAADPIPSDALVKYNVDLINDYRAKHRSPPLVYDAKMSAFANAGSQRLSQDHRAHAHFAASGNGSGAFGSMSAENQGDPRGVPPMAGDPLASGKLQIAAMMKLMMDEGPGGGHYENMLNPQYRRVGIGLVFIQGTMYLTNDFSD